VSHVPLEGLQIVEEGANTSEGQLADFPLQVSVKMNILVIIVTGYLQCHSHQLRNDILWKSWQTH
jgi:hypothetical protein